MNPALESQMAVANVARAGVEGGQTLPSGRIITREQVAAFDALGSFEDANDTCKAPRDFPPFIIQSMILRGEFGGMTSDSKARKTYVLMHSATSVAYGVPFFGFKVCKVPVLYLNYELFPAAWDERLLKIRAALGVPLDAAGTLRAWHLRAKRLKYKNLLPAIEYRLWKEENIWPDPPGLIIIDPGYKTWIGEDELSSGAMGQAFECFGELAQALNAAVLVCLHAPKGDNGKKRALDLSSGSGIQGRALDFSIALRIPHEELDEPNPITAVEVTRRHGRRPPKIHIQFSDEKGALVSVVGELAESLKASEWKDADMVFAFPNEDERMTAKALRDYYKEHSGKTSDTSAENALKRLSTGTGAVLGKVGHSSATRYFLSPRGQEARRAKLGKTGGASVLPLADSAPADPLPEAEF